MDNLLIVESNQTKIDKFKELLMVEFEMIDLGKLRYYFLGMEFVENN